MSDWRDDLPPIPSDEIRRDVYPRGKSSARASPATSACRAPERAGHRRGGGDRGDRRGDRAGRRRRRDSGSVGNHRTGRGDDVHHDAAAHRSTGRDRGGGNGGTEAESAGTDEAAEGTDQGEDTTVSAPEVFEVMVVPHEIWEQPANGTACGPTTLEVTFQPQTMTPLAPVVHWLVGGVNGELPMVIDGNVARATIGPFGPDTLDTGFADAVFLYVTDSDAAGVVQQFDAPMMLVLHDCPP